MLLHAANIKTTIFGFAVEESFIIMIPMLTISLCFVRCKKAKNETMLA